MSRFPVGASALVLLAALLVTPAVVHAAEARLGVDASRAFDMAKAAEDGAAGAHEEGEGYLEKIQGVATSDAEPAGLEALRQEADTAFQALAAYERQARAAASEAFHLLAEATRAASAAPPDLPRQQVFEERAVLAAHEAAVMAARARTESERLRAVHAEVRVLLAGQPAEGAPRAAGRAAAEMSARDVTVPNLVGARLEAAERDLAVTGLRLGPIRGPHDGFVVDQEPAAGVRVPRQTAVQVMLSGTAAGVKVIAPR